jgi:hypothetical protein
VTEFDRLTDIEVKTAKPRQKAYALSDGGGLYLWVTPSGGKLWRWSYVPQDQPDRAGGEKTD